jgi:uncharacterized protein (DUF2336 family)
MDYSQAKALAGDADPAVRRSLAERADLQPEILYFLAEDAEPAVRAVVADNPTTPRQADAMLARDGDVGVRERLAEKIGRLAPGLSGEAREHIRALTLDVLTILAADRAVRVRQIVAESIKDMVDAPRDVIQRLARDVEIKVAGPVLESSPLLSDAELIEIIQSKPIQGALTAIARRRRLGMKLTDALVATAATAPDGVLAVATLLKNHDAEIDDRTMEKIVDLAPTHLEWHGPLVERPKLPALSFRRLAGFLSASLLNVLKAKVADDPERAGALDDALAQAAAPAAAQDVEIAEADAPQGEAAIGAAAARGALPEVAAAMARDSGIPRATVRKMLASASAKAIVALAWKCGYPMSLALAIQTGIGGLAAADCLQANGKGDYPKGDYPLSEDDMEWQLEIFQAPTGKKPTRRPSG